MIQRSRDVAKRLSKGVEYLLKKNKIDYIPATGKLLTSSIVIATDRKGKKTKYQANNIIIATGARAKSFPGMEMDGEKFRLNINTYLDL